MTGVLNAARLVEAAANALRELILDGNLEPGARLREHDFAERLGIARHSFRAATQILIGEGLLKREPHRGVEVAILAADDVADIFKLREALEIEAVRAVTQAGVVPAEAQRAVTEMSFTAGQQYEIVIVSIDPKDTSELASAKKQHYTQHYHRIGAEAGWHFLTSPTPAPVAALARAVGFYYRYDPRQDQFAHPSGVITLTPSGQVSRYFYGIDYLPTHLRYGLIEAAAGKIGSPVDQLLLRCYHYDGQTGRYRLAIWRGVQLACALMALAVAVLLRPRAWRRQP